MRIIITKDFMSGLLFLVFGLSATQMASNYRLGTAMQMGPGYFPMLIGG